MELNKNTRKWILILVAISLGMVWVMQRLQFLPQFFNSFLSFFMPPIIGIMIAFVVNLPMRWLERNLFSRLFKNSPKFHRSFKRPLSLITALLLVVGVIVATVFMLVPDLVRTMISFAQQLNVAFREVQKWIDKLSQTDSGLGLFLKNSNLSINDLIMRISNWINNTVTEILSSAFGWITNLVNGFVNFFIGFVFAIYFLLQKEKLGRQIRQVAYAALPEAFVDHALQLGKLINTVFSRFLGGQGLEALILGSLVFIGSQIFRFPYPLTISVLVAVGALIPVFGATIAGILGALLIVVDSPIQAFWFVVMLLSIQQVEGNFIYPRVVGKSVGLPPVWVLLAVTLGSKLFGFFGLLLGVPMFSVVYILLRSWSGRRVEEKNIPDDKLDSAQDAADTGELLSPLEQKAAAERRAEKKGNETMIGQMTADWEAAEAEEAVRLEEEAAERRSETPKAAPPGEPEAPAEPAHKVRKFKATFDLDKVERELEREAEEAAEIRRRAWKGKKH